MWDLKFHLNGHMWTSGEHNLTDKDKKNERKFEKLELVKVCKFYHISFFFFLENSSQVGSLWNVVNMEVIESACELKCPSTNVSPVKKKDIRWI